MNCMRRMRPTTKNSVVFKNLASLLHNICGHNVWEFEYADICGPVLLPSFPFLCERCVNYGNLTNYSNELIEAIEKVKSLNSGSAVNIIAHSMGGLIARCAAQEMRNGAVNKIVTLDTGHFGFKFAAFADDVLINQLPLGLKTPVDCAEDARPGSKFYLLQIFFLFRVCLRTWKFSPHTSAEIW